METWHEMNTLPVPTITIEGYPHHIKGYRLDDERNQSGADNDFAAFYLWVNGQRSMQTKKAYYREVYRLMLWATEFAEKPVSALNLADYDAYKIFLRDPPPHWKGARRVKENETPGLIVKAMREKTIEYAITCISAMLTFWKDSGYISNSPLKAMIRKRPKKDRSYRHSLSTSDLTYIVKAINAMPVETEHQQFNQARIRWAFILFIRLGLRIEEVVSHNMSSFVQVLEKSQHQWKFLVWGKGVIKDIDHAVVLPVTPEILQGLREYRKFMWWLPEYPMDQTLESFRPLVARDTKGNRFSQQKLRDQMNSVFAQAADILETEDTGNPGVIRLRKTTPHILRHTAITLFGNACGDIRIQQQFARHNDINTTMLYHHTEQSQILHVMLKLKINS